MRLLISTLLLEFVLIGFNTYLLISKPSTLDISNLNIEYYYQPLANSKKTNYPPDSIAAKPCRKTTNADGLYDTKNYSIEKQKDTYRIVVLGDSFVDGAYVNTKDTWPELLEQKLNEASPCDSINKYEVIT